MCLLKSTPVTVPPTGSVASGPAPDRGTVLMEIDGLGVGGFALADLASVCAGAASLVVANNIARQTVSVMNVLFIFMNSLLPIRHWPEAHLALRPSASTQAHRRQGLAAPGF